MVEPLLVYFNRSRKIARHINCIYSESATTGLKPPNYCFVLVSTTNLILPFKSLKAG